MKRGLYFLIAILVALCVVAVGIYRRTGDTVVADNSVQTPNHDNQLKPPEEEDRDDIDPSVHPSTQPVAYRRWAVLPTRKLATSGVADLLMDEVGHSAGGVQFVEREQLAAITEEQRLSAMLGADAAQRVALGKLLKADALIMLTDDRAGEKDFVRLVVADTSLGIRIAAAHIPIAADKSGQAVKALASAIDQARRRFAGGVKLVVGVPPFLSKDLTHEHDHLKGTRASLVENALLAAPGVAVVEIDEARAVRNELDIAAEKSVRRALPFFVQVEYETSRGPDSAAEPLIALKASVTDGVKTIRNFECPSKPLSEAASMLTNDLPAVILDASNQGYRPLSRSRQVKLLARRADEFAALGSWQRAVSLRESILVMDALQAEQRKRIISEILQWLREEQETIALRWRVVRSAHATYNLRNPDPTDFDPQLKADMDVTWLRCLPEWTRAVDHLEFLVRNRQIPWPEAHDLLQSLAFVDFSQLRPFSSRNRDLRAVRTRLQAVVSDLGSALELLAQEFPAAPGAEAMRWRNLAWWCVVGAYPTPGKADLPFVAELIKRFPDDPNCPPPPALLRTFQNMSKEANRDQLAARTDESDYTAFLELIEKSNKRPLTLLAAIARVWMTDLLENSQRPRDQVRARLEPAHRTICEIAAEHRQWGPCIPDIEFGTRVACQIDLRAVASTSQTFGVSRAVVRSTQPDKVPTLTAPTTVAVTAPAIAGPLSFEEHALQVLSDGRRVPIVEWKRQQGYPTPPFDLFLLPCAAGSDGKGTDVVWDRHAVFLHRQLALLQPLMVQGDEIYRDVAFDGRNIYVATGRHGLFIFDTDGKTIARLTEAEGLPPADAGVALAAIGQGKILVAGSFGAEFRGWIAIVENDANTSKFSINVFRKATRAPDPGLIQKRDSDSLRALAKDPQCVFRPEWAMLAPPGPDTPARAVWIARGRTNELNVGDDEWMRVDLQTLKVSVSDFKPSSVKPLQFISDDEMIVPSGSLYRCRLGGRAQSGRFGSLLLYHAVPESHATFIRYQGRSYVPGSDWYLLDTDSWNVQHLGPGVKFDRHPATFLRYASSSVCGLLGYSEERFYPISVDPQRPLAIRATPNDWNGPRRIESAVDPDREVFGNIRTLGNGRFIWSSGHAVLEIVSRDGGWEFRASPPWRDRNLEVSLSRLNTIIEFPEERQRLGLSAEQIERLKRAERDAHSHQVDTERFTRLYAAY